MKVTLHRFGRKRRLVLILEWLTLWPTCGLLAVSSQRRDIVEKSSSIPAAVHASAGQRHGPNNMSAFKEPRTYRGRWRRRQGWPSPQKPRKQRVPPGVSAGF